MKTDFKVALVAAASNEAAYVVDWVFHHLHFGFAPILIYVNRSQDGTEALLRQIAKTVPDLQVHNIDDVDKAQKPKTPQREAFHRARQALKKQQGRGDYTTFADIDEFWTPADFTSTIQEVLEAAGTPNLATFNWFQLTSDASPFARPFEPQMQGIHHQLVKTSFRSHLKVRRFSVHGIKPLLPWPHWNASGGQIERNNWHLTTVAPTHHGPAFFMHRLYRSPLEYLAILGRGRSSYREILFKNNRIGYHDLVHRGRKVTGFEITAPKVQTYDADRLAFITALDIDEALSAASETVTQRARHVLSTYIALDTQEKEQWSDQFRWLDLEDLAGQLGLG